MITTVSIVFRMVIRKPPATFIADRPFMFVIHEKTSNTVLFIGKFVSPSQ